MTNVERHQEAQRAFNDRDWEAVRALCDDGLVYTDHPRSITVKSGQEFVSWAQEWATAFSDSAITEPTYLDAGDFTVCTFTGVGTNDGPLGPLPASGQRVSFPLCEILRWGPDGKIVSGEVFYDQATLLIQTGNMPPPPTTG